MKKLFRITSAHRAPLTQTHTYTKLTGTLFLGLYKILFCFWACVHDLILFSAHPLFVQAPNSPVIAHTIVQHNVFSRPPVIVMSTTQYWQEQYRVKVKLFLFLCVLLRQATLPLSELRSRLSIIPQVRPIFIHR